MGHGEAMLQGMGRRGNIKYIYGLLLFSTGGGNILDSFDGVT